MARARTWSPAVSVRSARQRQQPAATQRLPACLPAACWHSYRPAAHTAANALHLAPNAGLSFLGRVVGTSEGCVAPPPWNAGLKGFAPVATSVHRPVLKGADSTCLA